MESPRRGLFFEDFEIGREFKTPARTVTATDIINFACLSGDFNEVHANWEYCKTTPFGEPIAHGPLIYAIAGGLQYASGINDGTLLALLQVDKVAHARTSQARRHDTHGVHGDRKEADQQAGSRRNQVSTPNG